MVALVPQRDYLIEPIDRSRRRRPKGRDDCPHSTRREASFERVYIHPPAAIAGNRFERQAEHAGDALMRIVCLS